MAIYKRKGRSGSWKTSSSRSHRRKRYVSTSSGRRKTIGAKRTQRVSVNVFLSAPTRKSKRR